MTHAFVTINGDATAQTIASSNGSKI